MSLFFCRPYNGVIDVLGNHTLTCTYGGDRTKHHNLLQDACVHMAWAAGWRPEPEKAGLLQARSFTASQGNDHEGGEGLGPEARRPADVYIPRWDLGGSAALDFAVTSGLRTNQLEQTVADGLSSLTSYEAIKDSYKDTAAHCAREDITFVPMVAEAHSGAWGPRANKVWLRLGKALSILSEESAASEVLRVRQNLGFALHKATARAILRRSPAYTITADREAANALLFGSQLR